MRLSSLSTRKLAAFGSLLMVAVAVSACGGSSGGSSSSSESTPMTSASAPATTAAGAGGAVTAAAGKKVFEANCGSCHTLAAAGTNGNVGPNLDDLAPDMATVVHQVTNGGGGMPAFGSQLSQAQIQSVAKYVASAAGSGGNLGGSSRGGGLP
jgi:mono/diheme cytochrome c family protein